MVSRLSHSPLEVLFFSEIGLLHLSHLALEVLAKPETPNGSVSNLALEIIVNVPPPPPIMNVSHDVLEVLLVANAREYASHVALELLVNVPTVSPQISRGRLGPRIQSH